MTRFTLSILAALVGITSSVVVLHLLHELRAEEVQTLRASNDRMKRAAFDKFRESKTTATPPTSVAPASGASPIASKSRGEGQSDYRFEGQDTPIATLQSFAWACDQGDVSTMRRLITIDPAARAKAEAIYTAMPVEIRAKAPDVETLAALLLVDDGIKNPFPRAELLARAGVEKVSDIRVRTRLPGTARDGGLYQRFGSDWKFVITEKAVDEYAARSAKK